MSKTYTHIRAYVHTLALGIYTVPTERHFQTTYRKSPPGHSAVLTAAVVQVGAF